jgi:hypothetical protein
MLLAVPFFSQRVLHNKKRLTQRALDGGDSSPFSNILLALSFFYSQALFSRAASNAHRSAVGSICCSMADF